MVPRQNSIGLNSLDEYWVRICRRNLRDHPNEFQRAPRETALSGVLEALPSRLIGPRIGKGTAALIPNLLLYPGSALVIDPKGELAQITSARRGHGSARVQRCLQQNVHILDPEDLVPGRPKARWNPLAELDPSASP